MSFGDDEDILQDFLVEAGEILERLSQQLVDLEQRPDDKNLLNAIFRGFHTVKGGAGFLSLTPMVQCCHVTENLFDILRNGKRTVTSELMDVVLQALDMVNQQFAMVSAREELPPVDPGLIAALERLVSCEDLKESENTAPVEVVSKVETKSKPQGDITDAEFEELLDAIADAPATKTAAQTATAGDEISEDEFENLLDQLHGKGKGPAGSVSAVPATTPVASASASTSSDDITDDEFEALLDQLHGKGKGPGVPSAAPAQPTAAQASSAPAASATSSDLINDDEFEALLDQLHGKGKGPSAPAATVKADAPKAEVKKESPKKEPPKKDAVKPEPIKSEPIKSAAKETTPAAKVETSKVAATAAATTANDKDSAAVETTVRVDTQSLDDIMNMVG